MPIELEVASLRTMLQYRMSDEESLNARLLTLEHLDETRRAVLWNIEVT
jgi:hypothetical protein